MAKKHGVWRNKSQHFLWGFTLIELLITVSIISVLAGSVFTALNPSAQFQKSQDAKRKADFSEIQKALDTYYQDNNGYPTNTDDFQIQGASWGGSWAPYMTTVPKDPNSSKSYAYYSPDTQTYYLYASLDNKNDPQACNSGNACASPPRPDTNCGSTCTYGASSSNANITQLAVMPTRIPVTLPPPMPTSTPGPTSTPAPTSTPVPPTPTPTPTGLIIGLTDPKYCYSGWTVYITDLNGGTGGGTGGLVSANTSFNFTPSSSDILFDVSEWCSLGEAHHLGPYIINISSLTTGHIYWDSQLETLGGIHANNLQSWSGSATGYMSISGYVGNNGQATGNVTISKWDSDTDVLGPYKKYLLRTQPTMSNVALYGFPYSYAGCWNGYQIFFHPDKQVVINFGGYNNAATGGLSYYAQFVKYVPTFPTDISCSTHTLVNSGTWPVFTATAQIAGCTSATQGPVSNYSVAIVGNSQSGHCTDMALKQWNGGQKNSADWSQQMDGSVQLFFNPDPNPPAWNFWSYSVDGWRGF